MLRRYTWEKAKEKLQHYRRRTPETSVLYRIVHHSRDDLLFQWELRFQHQHGCMRVELSYRILLEIGYPRQRGGLTDI
jgi:hypothetical protein